MWKLVLGLSLLILLFLSGIAGSLYIAWYFALKPNAHPTTDDWKNFSAIAGIGITASAAVLSAVAAFVNIGAQANTAKDVEHVKKVLEKSIPAYANMFAAALAYYRALAPLETGNFSTDGIEVAEGRMKDAEGECLFVIQEYTDAWETFWSDARFTKEAVNRDHKEAESRKLYWRDRCKRLADDLEAMKSIARRIVKG